MLYIRALSADPCTLVVRFSGCHVTKDPEFARKARRIISPFQEKIKCEQLHGCDLLAMSSSIPKYY
ncbi:hypothetical protein SPRG_18621 [Saprolegnia parasitica CBS 223.65]|uniref:Uncharacterized protein n=1 Tax=Saprolegnia parasitica (strain CBS 223.65) TaxID=695850 RepID=A0A067BCL1_SAPPC|nr:hypothetical protein SPRG_18621 [Saprolegnia parasitica CBS 223.65]KDO15843.1 hypothetical protein SPRG_18621 [Saprolegnia parasitica CBS 223.65]|eukprot:XP_012213451.1 hypothetical protein SPRG_18621 [Saprolegnia parasitica CBS 223.65]